MTAVTAVLPPRELFGAGGVLAHVVPDLLALAGHRGRPPMVTTILLENALRATGGHLQDGVLEAVVRGSGAPQFDLRPTRLLMQDFTGVPALVDIAALRSTVAEAGGDPGAVDVRVRTDLVIDHSVIAEFSGTADALARNIDAEFARNAERYSFVRWCESALHGLRVVPPGTGIVHQVNVEWLATVVDVVDGPHGRTATSEVVLGSDSHTTMVNGLGVLGWGTGGIEVESMMLGHAVRLPLPPTTGIRVTGRLQPGVTATDLVLLVAERLRAHGVVGRVVEFFGPGLASMSAETRLTVANMSPEFGCTSVMFPVDARTLSYLRSTGRAEAHLALVEAWARAQRLWHDESDPPAVDDVLELDLADAEPSLAGPRRPQDRVALSAARDAFRRESREALAARGDGVPGVPGPVLIAAITSCTNTSNPEVMVAAGLLARNAVARGLTVAPWVKTSLAPGSRVVTDYLDRAGLSADLNALGFQTVGYGCTTCSGSSGPLAVEAVPDGVAVLSGNRNFSGRVHTDVAFNYLASPPLVVAYALAGSMDVDLAREPLGHDRGGEPVHLKDLWPGDDEVAATVAAVSSPVAYTHRYSPAEVTSQRWEAVPIPAGDTFAWWASSTYVRRPDFTSPPLVPQRARITGARALLQLGDDVTTDHISPAGAIRPTSPAGRYLSAQGVPVASFNSYGARRGNHEVMVRAAFASPRLRNLMVDVDGGVTLDLLDPACPVVDVHTAAERYARAGVPLVVLAGSAYGSGSSRDWAAKGTRLLGVRAVIAESFERIHRANLVLMGVLPLRYAPGESASTLGLTGQEAFDLDGLKALTEHQLAVRVTAGSTSFDTVAAFETAEEVHTWAAGGLLTRAREEMTA